MSYPDKPDDVDPSIRLIIAAKVRRIAARQVHEQDRGDLVQHLLLRVLERENQFDPARGTSDAYAAVVVRTSLANYLRDRIAGKRASRGTTDAADTFNFIADSRSSRDTEMIDLALDVADVLARLPADLRELAEELKRGTLSDAARALGRPRVSLYPRLAALRREFERANFGNYH